MNDNRVRGPQWQRLLGEFLPSRLGGNAEQWAEANRVVIDPLLDILTRDPLAPYDAVYREYRLAWVRAMCEHLGIPAPDDKAALALERDASDYVTQRVRSALPGAVEAIRAFGAAGFVLHTASGEASFELDGYLRGMGVREHFGHLFGPDVVNVWKGSAEYYRRMFVHASIDPTDVLIVDDNEQPCVWAREAGAHVVRITREQSDFESVPSLGELASRLLSRGD